MKLLRVRVGALKPVQGLGRDTYIYIYIYTHTHIHPRMLIKDTQYS